MRIPLSWLKEYIQLDISNEALADILTLAGLEVDKIEPIPFSFTGIITAEVQKTDPHPNAEKLKIAQVFDGNDVLQIVCGAPNCKAGMKVALATIGGTLTDEKGKSFKIKKSKLRDVESFGMLCSEKELQLGEDDCGIMELEKNVPVGIELSELFGDVIFEISLTPNLGHCMSMVGLGRDLAALLDKSIKYPEVSRREGTKPLNLDVEVKDPDHCYRYSCRRIYGVQVGSSPKWMKDRLERSGIRSINNIVDVTNYVMLELGQPLHAFDGKKIAGQKLIVQSTKSPITFETLDGGKRNIPENILMIHDNQKPIAVAGIMGGANTEVNEQTTEVILEAAHFNPSTIRRGCKALGIRSESSSRFERGIDFEMVSVALDRAAHLISQLGGGEVAKEKIDITTKEQKRRKIKLRLNRTNQILGTKLSLNEIESFLKRLEMTIKTEGETLLVTIPSYRNDIHSEIDLIEEVARIYGYNNIEKREAHVVNSPLPHAAIYLMEKKIRTHLIGARLQEFLTCDLISPELSRLCLEKDLGEKEEIRVLKPSSVDQSILRMSLLPGMLQAVKYNFDRKIKDIAAFEIGKIHFKDGSHFKERLSAGILLTGNKRPHHWSMKSEKHDFFDLKGILENLLGAYHVQGETFSPIRLKSFHPGKQAALTIDECRIGVLGEVHPNQLKHLDIEERVFFAQIDLHELMTCMGKEKKMTPLPQYPGSERDWTITLHKEVPFDSISAIIRDFHSKLLKKHFLLDLYESEKIGKDKKNITLRFIYRDAKQTVEQSQVEKEHTRLIKHVTERIRDFIS